MLVRVKCFASIRELISKSEIELELADGATTSDVLAKMAELFPVLESELESTAVAVNMTYVTEPLALRPTDVVAILPPISGG